MNREAVIAERIAGNLKWEVEVNPHLGASYIDLNLERRLVASGETAVLFKNYLDMAEEEANKILRLFPHVSSTPMIVLSWGGQLVGMKRARVKMDDVVALKEILKSSSDVGEIT